MNINWTSANSLLVSWRLYFKRFGPSAFSSKYSKIVKNSAYIYIKIWNKDKNTIMKNVKSDTKNKRKEKLRKIQ